MRLTTIFLLVIIVVIAICGVVLGSPAKDNKKQAPACSRDCGDKYEPVCAKAKNSSKERLITFGNECVMANYNCAHADDPFEVKSTGECGGNVSVRLS